MNTFNYNASVKRVQLIFANYRPKTHLMYEIRDINCGRKDLESFIQKYDSELSEIESIDPVIAGQFEVTNYMNRWKLQYNGESVTELRQMALNNAESDDITTNDVSHQFDVNSNDLVHCIYGTSRTRAEEWRDHGLGFVWTEKMFPNGSRIGLQVNCPDLDACRCNNSRLNFYADNQSEKSLNEEPVVVEFDIPAKYIYCENNRGEFQIDQENWKECLNFKILDLRTFNLNNLDY